MSKTKTVQEILNLTVAHLEQHSISHPRRQAEDIVSAVLGMKRLNIYMNFDRPLSDAELQRCREILARRVKGEPLQYILEVLDFYGCSITVTPDVLIPRHETELLVDRVVKTLSQKPLEGKVLVDMCCGSGCIGIALKKQFPELDVILSDIDEKALDRAKRNAADNSVSVRFFQGDLIEAIDGVMVDYIVCNPPYIAEEEYCNLEREVVEYEPRHALVGGLSGLEFYQRLSVDLCPILNDNAMIWMEIGSGQGRDIVGLFSGSFWCDAAVLQDLSGSDRFFFVGKA